ncbi:AfsR/SARP family transcriptional regulator [Actinoplanes sp. NPDC024001]|uniref:AfsR/SARP family transcriptional regulator n=1 Tax=Actinoplanes sp. NPDC024001 TaxID=3154598 RepID=UPI0033E751E7
MNAPAVPVRISVLGPVRLWLDGHEVPAGSPQQQSLLAALVLRDGRPATADELISAIWDDEAPRAAHSTARTYVYRLRRLLAGSDVSIETIGGGYALAGERASIDVRDFEAAVGAARERIRSGDPAAAAELLRGAEGLWSGTALAGVPGSYAQGQRARLAELRLAATELCLTARLRTAGAGPEEVAGLAALVEEHPLREGLRALLMLALYQQGRQAEALEVYQRGRRLLRDELALEPGPELQRMHQRVLAGDPTLVAGAGPAPAVAGPVYLPADLPDFVGREAEIGTIVATLTGPAPTVGVTGREGAGRTSTVVHAAHRLAGAFPHGRLYADLSEAGGAAEALLMWLRLAGVEGDLPAGTAGRAALLRATVGDRRILVVLDNVASPEQIGVVRCALPGAAVLFTARRRLMAVSGATWVTVGALTGAEAMLLMERVAGAGRIAAERAATVRLIELTGGDALAVRLAGHRVDSRPRWSVASIADELAAELGNPATVMHDDCLLAEAPIVRAYGRLRPLPARLLRLVAAAGPVPSEISAGQAARLLDVGVHDAWRALESLADVCLLAVTGAEQRYRLADPVVWAMAMREAHAVDGAAEIAAATCRLTESQVRLVAA